MAEKQSEIRNIALSDTSPLPSRLSVIPIRDVVVLPGSRVAFKIGRVISKSALQFSLTSTKQFALFTQLDAANDDPTMDELYPIGTLCDLQQHEQQGEQIRLVVSAVKRVEVAKRIQSTPFFVIEPAEVKADAAVNTIKLPPQNHIHDALSLLKKYRPEKDIVHSIPSPLPFENEPGKLADYLVAVSTRNFENGLACLLELNPDKRLTLAYKILVEEAHRAQLESEINERVTAAIRDEHKGVFLRGQLKIILEELGEDAPLSLYNPVFRGRNFKVNPELTFVLMPFAERFDPIYSEIIKPVVEQFGLMCIRADNLYHSKPIMEDIWKFLNEARIVIADVTGKNPNVFYEIGLAHAIGKEVIIISQSTDDIPFDLRHLRTFTYQDSVAGFRKLEHQLTQSLSTIDGLKKVKAQN